MRKAVPWALGLAIGLMFTIDCMCEAGEPLHIDRQIMLSPGHRVMPYSITRASNGDFFVIGSNDQMDYRAWATRLAPNGEVRWEFLEGGPDGWNDRTVHGQRFNAAIEMPDETTLLCGEKVIDRRSTVMLVTLAKDGSLISEKLLPPVREGSVFSGLRCRKWNDGIVLVGGVSGRPAGTGWMIKLDMHLNMLWKKFSDDYAPGEMTESGHDLYVLGWHGSEFYIVKIGLDGEIIAKHLLTSGEHHLVQTGTRGKSVRVATLVSTLQTEIADFDADLHGPARVLKLNNVGIKKCLELPDGSVAIFGSQFSHSATAAVTRVYKDGGYKTFLVEPRNESPWYIDAVLTGNGNEIAAVRQVGVEEGMLDFLSFK